MEEWNHVSCLSDMCSTLGITESDVLLFPVNRSPYRECDVTINLSGTYNRQCLPPEQEDRLHAQWTRRLQDNPRLWDGSKFRLHSTSNKEDGTVMLNLGVTGYKDYLCTNWSGTLREVRDQGLRDHSCQQAYMADPLGVGCLVQTNDDHFILLRRSRFCGECVGMLDRPGGHPEPQELVGKLSASQITELVMSAMSPEAIKQEIFNSIVREVCDEVNLTKESITRPVLLGIVRNHSAAGRPSAEFYCRCSLSHEEIRGLYQQGSQIEAEETTNISFLPMSSLSTLHQDEQIWQQMTPSAQACVSLYNIISARESKPVSVSTT